MHYCLSVRCNPGSWSSTGSTVISKGPTEPQLCSVQMLEHRDLHTSRLEAAERLQSFATMEVPVCDLSGSYSMCPAAQLGKKFHTHKKALHRDTGTCDNLVCT